MVYKNITHTDNNKTRIISILFTLLGEIGLSHDAVHQTDGLHRVATLGGLCVCGCVLVKRGASD